MYINKQDDLNLINSNNPKDLNKLYNKYSTIINGIFFSKTRDKETSLDMTQDVLIKIHNNLHNFNKNMPFNRWVFSIATNHFLDQQRSLKWYKGNSEYNQLSLDSDVLRETLCYEHDNDFNFDTDLISEIMVKLNEEEKLIFDLYFNKNYKVVEITKTMLISKKLVNEKINNLINKIKSFNLELLPI